MKIEEKINESIKDSMKKKDNLRLDSLRAIKSAILIEKTKSGSKDHIEESVILKILQKMVKQRNDSAKIYLEQKRDELANVEISQADIISEFLPAQLSESDLSEIIDKVIIDIGADSMKDMGKVISGVTDRVSGQAEGRVIAEIVKRKLIRKTKERKVTSQKYSNKNKELTEEMGDKKKGAYLKLKETQALVGPGDTKDEEGS
jgi:uncharacterized protein YqeY